MAVGTEVVLLCVVANIYVENRSNKKRRTVTGETFFCRNVRATDHEMHNERFSDVR
jgi:hypothetical protein